MFCKSGLHLKEKVRKADKISDKAYNDAIEKLYAHYKFCEQCDQTINERLGYAPNNRMKATPGVAPYA